MSNKKDDLRKYMYIIPKSLKFSHWPTKNPSRGRLSFWPGGFNSSQKWRDEKHNGHTGCLIGILIMV